MKGEERKERPECQGNRKGEEKSEAGRGNDIEKMEREREKKPKEEGMRKGGRKRRKERRQRVASHKQGTREVKERREEIGDWEKERYNNDRR